MSCSLMVECASRWRKNICIRLTSVIDLAGPVSREQVENMETEKSDAEIRMFPEGLTRTALGKVGQRSRMPPCEIALPVRDHFSLEESEMKLNTPAMLAGLIFVVLSGCQKAPEPKTSGADPTSGSSPASSPTPPGGSVALPAEKMPPSAAAQPPASQSTGSSGDANSPTQANPSTLQKQQEQAAMPQSGQANNHSVPETVGTTK